MKSQPARLRSALLNMVVVTALLGELLAALMMALPLQAAENAVPLDVRINAAYNLVVDSNVSSPSTYAPSVATVIGEFCNTGSTTLTNVQGYIGNWQGSLGASTPGTYPSRDSTTFGTEHPALVNSGTYAFEHVGGQIGTADATRFMGDIAPGECRVQYWHFTYPQCENNADGSPDYPPCDGTNSPTWGDSVKPEDDLWLNFDIWGSANSGGSTVTDDETWTMTMRNEISAMANKIEPNPLGDWFNTNSDRVSPGETITTNGILYELGNINQGFDNDGDFTPDYNAWLQPIGDPSYDPSCFRLISTEGYIEVSRSAGQPDLIIPFEDQLYFTDLPADNTGVIGYIYYTFLALDGPCNTAITPYQEVASSFDNEKFNGDYGTGIPPVGSSEPDVNIDKFGNTTIALGGTIDYSVPFENTGDKEAGSISLELGTYIPLVVEDTVPDGLEYVCGSAASNNTFNYTPTGSGVIIRYSDDGGTTWSTDESDIGCTTGVTSVPSTGDIVIQWWLTDELPTSADSGSGEFTFQAVVPNSYSTHADYPVIENCADASLGGGAPFDENCAITLIEGSNDIGDFVWRDEDNDGTQDDGNTGIDGVTVSLYLDRGTVGTLDDEDILIDTTITSGASTSYLFQNLPDADYIVTVPDDISSLLKGYFPTTDTEQFITLSGADDLTADFGYGPSLRLDKTLTSGDPSYEGDEIVYTVDLINTRPGDGEPPGPCSYVVWATALDSANSEIGSNKEWTNYPNVYDSASGPNGTFATAPYANAGEKVAVTNFSLGETIDGTITQVEALVYLQKNGVLAGGFDVNVIDAVDTYAHAFADVTAIPDGYFAVDVTEDRTWASSDFTGAATTTSIQLIGQKSGNPPGTLDADAAGYRITTDATCGEPGNTIDPLTFTDTYDTSKMTFLSASTDEGELDCTDSSGTITCDAAPLYGGQTKTVTLRFTALEPPSDDGDPGPITDNQNCASVTGSATTAALLGGFATNDASDCVTSDIYPGGTIGDFVYLDANGNGTYDTGDMGLRGVTAQLYDCGANGTCEGGGGDDVLVDTTTTDADGAYLFSGVADIDRNYEVVVDTTTLPGAGTITWINTDDYDGDGDDDSGAITIDYDDGVTGNDDFLDADFGYSTNGVIIFGTIWHDRNQDGEGITGDPDSNEEWISGVTVTLEDIPSGNNKVCGAQGEPDCPTTVTDENGYFIFTSFNGAVLPDDNTYTIVVDNTTPGDDPLSGWTASYDTDGTGTPDEVSVTIPAGGDYGRGDFSYYKTGTSTIGDTVYEDVDGDGTQDTGEGGFAGVDVLLYEDLDNDGVVDEGEPLLETTTTADGTGADPKGYYQFTNVADGNYIVQVDPADIPNGYSQTQDPDETGVCSFCDAQSRVAVDSDVSTSYQDEDFGFEPLGGGSIGDLVWEDINQNGVYEPAGADGITGTSDDETGLANISLTLYQDVNGNGVYDSGTDLFVASTETDASGNYLFDGLPAGDYLVDVDTSDSDLPTGYALTTQLNPDDVSDPRPNDPHPVTLAEGEQYEDADFGFYTGAIIGDYIWQDTNGDGYPDAGEPGIANVTVTLLRDADGDGTYETTVGTADTDANGYYEFTGLPGGYYRVVVDEANDIPAGYTQTYDPDERPPCTATNSDYPEDYPANKCDGQSGSDLYSTTTNDSVIRLYPGQVDRSRDFGYQPTLYLGDTVWIDGDNDGVRGAEEAGIPGVTVELHCISGSCTAGLVDTTTTDIDGIYGFGGTTGDLPDGDYEIRVTGTIPTGLSQSYDPDGTIDAVTSVTISGGAVTAVGSCTTGTCNLEGDFGYRYTGTNSVSGTIFHDDDTDGVYEPSAGETTTYENVTIYLYRMDPGTDGVCNTADDTVDSYVGSTTTADGTGLDPKGYYAFTGLAAGCYTVSYNEDAPNLAGTQPTPLATPITYRTVSVSGTVTDQDFGVISVADFGDLPDEYNTTLAASGPRHQRPDGGYTVYLGDTVAPDEDPNGTASSDATGDDTTGGDDEDGVQLNGFWTAGTDGGPIRVTATCPTTCYLSAWIDWDQDGSFAESGDNIFLDQAIVDGVNDLTFDIPSGETFGSSELYNARFRIYETSTDGLAQSTGLVLNGEVEDYQWTSAETTPVTLAYFRAQRDGADVTFEWSTATELGNLGFNLYVEGADGRQLLNEEPIPSLVIDSVEPQHYQFSQVTAGNRFYLEDISIWGESTFHGPFQLGRPYGAPPQADPINWEVIREQQQQAVASHQQAWPHRNYPSMRILVDEDGIYRLSIAALREAGLDLVRVPVNQISLWSQGQPVPFYTPAKGLFKDGDYLEFVGRGLNTLYTGTNVYVIQVGENSRRITVDRSPIDRRADPVAYYLETTTVDDNRLYSASTPHDDPWSAAILRVGRYGRSYNYPLTLDAYVPDAPPNLSLRLWGASSWPDVVDDHHLIVQVNGTTIADERFDGVTSYTLDTALPDVELSEGNNTLTLRVAGDTGARLDQLVLDRYSITYPRAFVAREGTLTFTASGSVFEVSNLPSDEITVYRVGENDVARLERITVQREGQSHTARFAGSSEEATYYVVSDETIHTPAIEPAPPSVDIMSGDAQYLIIAHPSFISGLEPLVAYHEGHGLQVRVVSVDSVYAEFSEGIFDPQAIKTYIAYAAANMGTEYILLVGGDSYDYRDYLGLGSLSFIPTLYTETVAGNVRFAPADALYADVDANRIPDLPIGRFPVRTQDELALMVDKTLAYAARTDTNTAVFAADKGFVADSRAFVNSLSGAWQVEEAYLDWSSRSEARQTLLQALNEGPAMASYVGHSGATLWSFDRLFTTQDAAGLSNHGKPSVVTQWGCWNTYYVSPYNNTLAHSLLLSGDQGAVAVLGASTLTLSSSERALGTRMMPLLTHSEMPMGLAIQQAKADLATTNPEFDDVLLGWTLLGDPTLVVAK
ncbi:MAG: SdrD B-like domain-containing protein [Anaerolineae bacterium]